MYLINAIINQTKQIQWLPLAAIKLVNTAINAHLHYKTKQNKELRATAMLSFYRKQKLNID